MRHDSIASLRRVGESPGRRSKARSTRSPRPAGASSRPSPRWPPAARLRAVSCSARPPSSSSSTGPPGAGRLASTHGLWAGRSARP